MELSEQIRIARESKGWSREYLAVQMGVSKTSVVLWETTGKIKIWRLQQLAQVLGAPLNAIGGAVQELPEFVTHEGIDFLQAFHQLPVDMQDAVRKIVTFYRVIPKDSVEPFFDTLEGSGIRPFLSGDLSQEGVQGNAESASTESPAADKTNSQ